MKFALEINCDNDAFTGQAKEQVADILSTLAGRLLRDDDIHSLRLAPYTLRDENGNRVGTAEFKES